MVFLMLVVSDLHETQNKKSKSTLLKSKSLDNFIDTSPNLINHSTDVTSPPPFYTKRPNKIQFPKFNLFPKRHHNSHHKRLHFLSLLFNILHFLIILIKTFTRMTI